MSNMNTVNYSMSNMFVNPKDKDDCIVSRVVLKLDYWHISISKPQALWVTNKNTDSWYCERVSMIIQKIRFKNFYHPQTKFAKVMF